MQKLIFRYILYTLLLYFIMIVLGANIWINTLVVLIFNLFMYGSYSFILKLTSDNKLRLNEKTLQNIIFYYSLVGVVILKIIFYNHHNTFFDFNALDSINYDLFVKKGLVLEFGESFNYFKRFDFDDLGALFYISTLYRIIESTLFVNFVNILCGVLSANLLFRLGKYFMPTKYAFASSLTFFAASFMLKFEASGLKEPIFVLLVISTFYHFYKYYYNKKPVSLFWFILLGGSILFFRPAVLGMIIVSISIGVILNRYGSSLRNLILSATLIVVFLSMSSTIEKITQTFDSFEKSIALHSDEVKISGEAVAIYAAALSSFIGPMPNLIARVGKESNSLYASGLMMRVLLAVPFWLGLFYILRKRESILYPLAIMSLLGMGALFYIMESYELRYHITHLPFTYLIAFYFLSYVESTVGIRRKKLNQYLKFGSIFVVLIVLYWNLRML